MRTHGVGTLCLNEKNMTYQMLALQLDPNRQDGGEMGDGQGEGIERRGREAGRRN